MNDGTNSKFKFIGGHLSLDFVNTVGNHLGESRSEYFRSLHDFISWSQLAGITSEAEKNWLFKKAADKPKQAAQDLQKVIAARESLFNMLKSLIENETIADKLLVDFNDSLQDALGHLKIKAENGGYAWNWDEKKPSIGKILGQILWTTANLVVSEEIKNLKMCGDEVCGWLFLDASKAKRRAWCDMKDCGNRNKARRFYSRRESATSKT